MVSGGSISANPRVFRDCPYREICTENRIKCKNCAWNPQRSHYVPAYPYYDGYPSPFDSYPWGTWTITYDS